MNVERLRQSEATLPAICRKVLSVVPVQQTWEAKDINTELYRLTRARVDKAVITGCLSHLVSTGLVKEGPRGAFRRMAIAAPEPTPLKVPVKKDPPRMHAIVSEEPFFDTLSRVADELRSLARSMDKAAVSIEDAALVAQKAIEDEQTKTAKYDQLKHLLKGIAD